jgi:hypothetical protein
MYKALLVGINAYPDAPLKGCLNDITDMATFIVSNCGFKESDIRLLADKRATTENIKERLKWLVDGVKPGDHLLFHYSGHGAQVPTRSASGEVDKLDEVICPVDFDWSDDHLIRDKDFHTIFSTIPEGVHFVWISDSCHSGDLSKELRRIRSIPMPEDIAWRWKTAQAAQMQPRAINSNISNVALIPGCRSNQTSADATFNNRPNGALTYFLLQNLKKASGDKLPISKLVDRVRADLKKNGYSQSPVAEGNPDLLSKTFAG